MKSTYNKKIKPTDKSVMAFAKRHKSHDAFIRRLFRRYTIMDKNQI